jgi:hypothetical protein
MMRGPFPNQPQLMHGPYQNQQQMMMMQGDDNTLHTPFTCPLVHSRSQQNTTYEQQQGCFSHNLNCQSNNLY